MGCGFLRISMIALSGVVLAGGGAYAQTIPGGVPQSVQPGRVLQPQLTAPLPNGAAGPLEIQGPVSNAAPAGADQIHFQLTDIALSGATMFEPGALRDMFKADIGHTISLADIYALAARITEKYRSASYILSQVIVPQQRIENGVVHLTVVEGLIDKVTVQGAVSDRLTAEGQMLTTQHPLTAQALERYLLLANDLPGLTVQAVVSPSPTVPGGADLTLVASRKMVDGTLEVDNFGSPYQGPWLGTANIGFNDLLGYDEWLALRYTTSSMPSEFALYGLDAIVPLNDEGMTFDLDASHTQGHPGFTLTPFDVCTDGTAVSLGVSYPLMRSRAENLKLAADLSYVDSITTLNVPGSSNDRARAIRFSAAYDLIDSYGGRNAVTGVLSQGLPIFAATKAGDPLASRIGASSNFTKLDVTGSRLQDLGNDFGLLGAVTAQTSFGDRLLSSEQFDLGGPLFGRGYDPDEITGDGGVGAKLELQKTLPVRIRQDSFASQIFGFYDVGETLSHASTDGVPPRQSLASAGAGIRFDLGHGLASTVELAKPLTRVVASQVGQSNDPKAMRAYFMLSGSF